MMLWFLLQSLVWKLLLCWACILGRHVIILLWAIHLLDDNFCPFEHIHGANGPISGRIWFGPLQFHRIPTHQQRVESIRRTRTPWPSGRYVSASDEAWRSRLSFTLQPGRSPNAVSQSAAVVDKWCKHQTPPVFQLRHKRETPNDQTKGKSTASTATWAHDVTHPRYKFTPASQIRKKWGLPFYPKIHGIADFEMSDAHTRCHLRK